MATLLPPGEQTFLDINGDPLAGGTVTFYTPQTTALRDTFQDAGGTIKNQNPITLDAAGRATIYGTGTYRQVLKDVLGNLIWDTITADTSASLASWGGRAAGSANHLAFTVLNFTGVDGQTIDFIATSTNTGQADAATNGAPPIPVQKDAVGGPTALVGGEIVAGEVYRLTYDRTAGLFHLTVFDRAYVDARDAATLSGAQNFAQGAANTAQSNAISTASTDATSKANAAQASAATDATTKANAAQSNAATDATAKANAAQTNATSAAATDATTKANNAQSAATSAAAADATTKANNAQSAAATDAATKANTAQSNAASDATSKANAAKASAATDATTKANAAQSNAVNNANTFATNADTTVTSNANAFAYTQASNAQANAIANATTKYVSAMQLSGFFSAVNTVARIAGTVMVGQGGSTNTYAYLQMLINGVYQTISG